MTVNSHEPSRRRWLSRSLWEGAATVVIALGVAMLMQPFSLTLYGWSFAMVLVGTLVFTIATKLPE
jgi:peptidoglycan/LPS O-acetylase OafA/YrhL